MTSPPKHTSPRLPTSTTSALDIPFSSVRRRVSGPYTVPSLDFAPTEPLEEKKEGDGYKNPFDKAQRVVQQQKLPPLGRELFSDDEDGDKPSAPPPGVPIISALSPPLPPLPIDATRGNYTSPYGQEAVPRLPTPNFAAVREDDQHTHDIDGRLGLFFKLTQPFRMFNPHSGSKSRLDAKVDSKGSPPAEITERRAAEPSYAPTPMPAPHSTTMSRRGTDESGANGGTILSGSSDKTAIRLIATPTEPLSRGTTKSARFLDVPDQEYEEDGTGSDGGSSTEGLLSRQPPHSPTLLAATHAATDRFTRRFPVSLSYRKANGGRNGESDDQSLLGLLGYGETGAVVEWPNAWTPEKWALLFSVCTVFAYGLCALLLVLMTWFGVWDDSIITCIVDYDILVTITSASLILLGTSIFGFCGTLLNSRPLLAMYCVLLWPSFVAMLVVGYTAYHRSAFALPNKLDQAWSQKWGDEDRMVLQYSLRCCGYWSPDHEATMSPVCFPRSMLPGCKARLLRFERRSLRRYYTWVFALVPLHVLNIVTAILCSNHVNRLFGKGLTPWQYRLSIADVRANALRVLETYQDTLIPLQPGRVYALRSRQFGDGTSRSPRIPQGGDRNGRHTQEPVGISVAPTEPRGENGWTGGMPFAGSSGSMFGFQGEELRRVNG